MPPSVTVLINHRCTGAKEIPTRETSCNEYSCEASEASNKRRSRDMPVVCTNVVMFSVYSDVDENANNNEDNNGGYLQGR